MEQCPICKRYMTFGMSYSCGNPVIFWTCPCGYDTRNQQVTYSTSVTYNKDTSHREAVVK